MSQLPGPHPTPAGSRYCTTWQDPHSDGAIRRQLGHQIHAVVMKKREDSAVAGWGPKLAEFVILMEQHLYHMARSQEEYMEPSTLEERLQQVATQMGKHPGEQSNVQGTPQLFEGSAGAHPGGSGPGQQDYLAVGMAPACTAGNGMQHHSSSFGSLQNVPGQQQGMGFAPWMPDSGSTMSGDIMQGHAGYMGNGMDSHAQNGMPGALPPMNGGEAGNMQGGSSGLPHVMLFNEPFPGNQTQFPVPPISLSGPGMTEPGGGGLNSQNHGQALRAASPAQQTSVSLAPDAFTGESADDARAQFVQTQQRWLIFLRHCAKCRRSEADCQLQAQCTFGKSLWQHILHCSTAQCQYPRCLTTKELLKHHHKCQMRICPICEPVRECMRKTQQQAQQQRQADQLSQQQQAEQHQESVEPKACVVCLDEIAATVFTSCGHMCCCMHCGLSMTECPICRTKGKCIRVFIA